MTMPGHLGATTKWTTGPTTLRFIIRGFEITITQDGKQLAAASLTGPLAERLSALSGLENTNWGDGIYGKFSGPAID